MSSHLEGTGEVMKEGRRDEEERKGERKEKEEEREERRESTGAKRQG